MNQRERRQKKTPTWYSPVKGDNRGREDEWLTVLPLLHRYGSVPSSIRCRVRGFHRSLSPQSRSGLLWYGTPSFPLVHPPTKETPRFPSSYDERLSETKEIPHSPFRQDTSIVFLQTLCTTSDLYAYPSTISLLIFVLLVRRVLDYSVTK